MPITNKIITENINEPNQKNNLFFSKGLHFVKNGVIKFVGVFPDYSFSIIIIITIFKTFYGFYFFHFFLHQYKLNIPILKTK